MDRAERRQLLVERRQNLLGGQRWTFVHLPPERKKLSLTHINSLFAFFLLYQGDSKLRTFCVLK